MGWRRGKFSIVAFILQVVFLVLFALFVRYGDSANASVKKNNLDPVKGGNDPANNEISHFYPMFQDVHVMMFIGFGFLMTFLKRYGFGAVGLNFLVAAFVLQWSTLMSGFLHLGDDHTIYINIETMLFSDFAAAAVLISFGAVLGKTSPLQLLVMALFEIAVFQTNEWIGLSLFHAVDVGGSMFVHTFGAYFGLTVTRILNDNSLYKSPAQDKADSHYHSDLFAMIGTIFLWMFWPSFNSAVAVPGDAQHRAVLNTYYALCSCTITTFIVCGLLDKQDKFTMVYIQNSTLAGGVAVGTLADLMIQPWGALLLGMIAAALSVLGFRFLTPFLSSKLHLHDTCGVNNLHGMPGIMAGIGGIVAAYMATEEDYGLNLYQIFPMRAPADNSTELLDIQAQLSSIEAGENWTARKQATMQAAALATTIAMAIVGGIITGLILRIPIWNQPEDDDIFEDNPFWEIPTQGLPDFYLDGVMVTGKGDVTLAIINSNDLDITPEKSKYEKYEVGSSETSDVRM